MSTGADQPFDIAADEEIHSAMIILALSRLNQLTAGISQTARHFWQPAYTL